jgi:hypothetical protein
MPMKPTPMPKKTGKPKKAMGMNMGGMAKPGYGDQSMPSVPKTKVKPGAGAPMPGRGVRPMPMPKTGMAKGGMTKKGKK